MLRNLEVFGFDNHDKYFSQSTDDSSSRKYTLSPVITMQNYSIVDTYKALRTIVFWIGCTQGPNSIRGECISMRRIANIIVPSLARFSLKC